MRDQEASKEIISSKPVARAVLAVFVMAVIYLNVALTIAGVEFLTGFHENRNLAPFPAFDRNKPYVEGFVEFTGGLSSFVGDHFALRKPLVVAINSIKYHVFNYSSDPIAMPSKEGWIYYGMDSMRRDFERTDGLPPQYMTDILQMLRQRRAWLERRGIEFRLVVVPNKHNVHVGHMPDFLRKGQIPSKGEVLVTYLDGYLPKTVVNVFGPLQREAGHRQLYFKIDTHWNHAGSKVAVDQLLKSLDRSLWKPFGELKDERRTITPGNFGRVMGVPLREDEVFKMPVGGWSWTAEPVEGLEEILPERATISVYSNPSAPDTTLLVLGDSYVINFEQYMAEAFGRSVFVNLWHTMPVPENRFPTRFIEAVKPDVLVFLFAERRLQYFRDNDSDYHLATNNPEELAVELGAGTDGDR